MAALGHPFLEVGITGYRRATPLSPRTVSERHFTRKQAHATYIVTQMCFSPQTIVDWILSIRSEGVTLPIKVGVPGAVDPHAFSASGHGSGSVTR